MLRAVLSALGAHRVDILLMAGSVFAYLGLLAVASQ